MERRQVRCVPGEINAAGFELGRLNVQARDLVAIDRDRSNTEAACMSKLRIAVAKDAAPQTILGHIEDMLRRKRYSPGVRASRRTTCRHPNTI